MKVGAYFTAWKGKNYWRLCKGYLNVFMDWELGGAPLPNLLGKRLWIDLGMYTPETETEEHVRLSVRDLRRYWKKIIALEMCDEPHNWPTAKLNAKAAMVKSVVRSEGLEAKPVGATFGTEHFLTRDNWHAAGLDYVSPEAYLDVVPRESPAKARARMVALTDRLLARAGSGKRLGLTLQSYTRAGTWAKNIPALVAIQEPVFQAAKRLGPRLTMLSLFAFARAPQEQGAPGQPPESVVDIPELKAEHQRLRKLYP